MELGQEAFDALQDDVISLGDVVNKQAGFIEEVLQLNERVINDIVDEVNLIWSMLELPWWRRVGRLNRGKALKRAAKLRKKLAMETEGQG